MNQTVKTMLSASIQRQQLKKTIGLITFFPMDYCKYTLLCYMNCSSEFINNLSNTAIPSSRQKSIKYFDDHGTES